MRATINIPDELIQAIQKATGLKSKTDAIVVAMKDFLKARKRDRLRSMRGKVTIDYDWRAEEVAEQAADAARGKYYVP